MVDATGNVLGRNLRQFRRDRRMTQYALANAADLSVDLVRKVEQGQRPTIRIESVIALAHALDRGPGELLAAPRDLPEGEDAEIRTLCRVISSLELLPLADPVPVAQLDADLDQLWETSWNGSMTKISFVRSVPELVRAAYVVADADPSPANQRRLAESLQLAAYVAVGFGREDMALVALARADQAARAASDELLAAALAHSRTWALLRQGWTEDAHMLAVRVADEIEPAKISRADPVQVAIWGQLLIRAATTAAREGDKAAAKDELRLVSTAADALGEDKIRRYRSVPFGPAAAHKTAVEVAVYTQQPRTALKIAGALEWKPKRLFAVPPGLTSYQHVRHLLNVARALTDDWRSSEALETMLYVERVAPEWVRYQMLARAIVEELYARREKHRLPGIGGLARRLGVAA